MEADSCQTGVSDDLYGDSRTCRKCDTGGRALVGHQCCAGGARRRLRRSGTGKSPRSHALPVGRQLHVPSRTTNLVIGQSTPRASSMLFIPPAFPNPNFLVRKMNEHSNNKIFGNHESRLWMVTIADALTIQSPAKFHSVMSYYHSFRLYLTEW